MASDEHASIPAAQQVAVVARDAEALLDALPVIAERSHTRQILKAKGVRVLRLSLDVGQVLSNRVEDTAMLIQTLQGRVILGVAEEQIDMPVGAVMHLERRLVHSLRALEPSHLMVTLLGPRAAGSRKREHHGGNAAQLHTGKGGAYRQRPRRPATALVSLDAQRRATPDWAHENEVLAATGEESAALNAITGRHAELQDELASRTSRLLQLLSSGSDAEPVRQDLIDWVRSALLPQLDVEAGVLYPVLEPQQRASVETLRAQFDGLCAAVERFEAADPGTAHGIGSAAIALRIELGRYCAAQSETVLPALAVSAEHSLALLWEQVRLRLTLKTLA